MVTPKYSLVFNRNYNLGVVWKLIQGQIQLSEQNFIEFFYFCVKQKQRKMFKFSVFVGH